MVQTVKVLAGPYWDYWFADDGIYRIQVVSNNITLAVMVGVFLVIFLLIDSSVLGGLAGIVLGYALGNWVSGRQASKKRSKFHTLLPQKLSESGLKFSRLRWEEISSANLKGKSLHLVVQGRRTKVPVPPSLFDVVKAIAGQKLGSKFTAD